MTDKVAGCSCIYVQHATFQQNDQVDNATQRATPMQPTPLKAASLLVLQRNQARNSSATSAMKPGQKACNFLPKKTHEKLHQVAQEVARASDNSDNAQVSSGHQCNNVTFADESLNAGARCGFCQYHRSGELSSWQGLGYCQLRSRWLWGGDSCDKFLPEEAEK